MSNCDLVNSLARVGISAVRANRSDEALGLIGGGADLCPHCGCPYEPEARQAVHMGLTMLSTGTLFYDGRAVHLPPIKTRLMSSLMRRGEASHNLLALGLRDGTDSATIRVHIHALRKALKALTGGALAIMNVPGWGYKIIGERQ